MAKLMNIRRPDVCVGCGAQLDAGTEAYWIAAERVVRCVTCHGGPTPVVAKVETVQDAAGRSAQQEYEKRSARELARKQQAVAEDAEWRESMKEKRPVLGRVVTAITPKPQITPESQGTKAWKTGAEGERRVAEVLTGVPGIEVLHDRRVPGSRANIDHIVVGPTGVYVVDAKKYTGEITTRDKGGLLKSDLRLYVGTRDQTKLVEAMLWQVDVVRRALGDQYADVPVRGVLCFIGCEWGWIKRAKHVKQVVALWPTALPGHVSADGPHRDRVPAVAAHLRDRLRPAT
jgi:hypothetical protein